MAWQLEVWLRLMVYVELRAARPDWEAPIRQVAREWPPRSLASDKRLHHMATAHQAGISYLTFGQLWQIVTDDQNWSLFEPYLPPKHNAMAKMEEVQAIRNRTAHFREPHINDEARLELFLQDFDQGLRQFCRRCALKLAPMQSPPDPVADALSEHWNAWGYGTELHGPQGWLYAPEPHRSDPLLHADLSGHIHKGYRPGGAAGLFYRLHMSAPISLALDVPAFLHVTKRLHPHVIHVEIPSERTVGVTLPAVAGVNETAELLAAFLDAARNSVRHGRPTPLASRIRTEWPEYVLWPNHPLCFYGGDEVDSLLDLSQ